MFIAAVAAYNLAEDNAEEEEEEEAEEAAAAARGAPVVAAATTIHNICLVSAAEAIRTPLVAAYI